MKFNVTGVSNSVIPLSNLIGGKTVFFFSGVFGGASVKLVFRALAPDGAYLDYSPSLSVTSQGNFEADLPRPSPGMVGFGLDVTGTTGATNIEIRVLEVRGVSIINP